MSIDDEVEVVAEDVPPFTMCPHWVLLSELTPQAKVLWWALAAHVHRRRAGGDVVWPSRQTLAAVLKMKQPQSVDPYIDELELYGAIRVERKRLSRMKVRHQYVVRFKAPDGCDAPMTVEEFYDRRDGVFNRVDNAS